MSGEREAGGCETGEVIGDIVGEIAGDVVTEVGETVGSLSVLSVLA